MYSPQSKGTSDSYENIDVFSGINLNERISPGELKYTLNCSSRKYPTVSARTPRGLVGEIPVDCMIAKGASLFYISGDKLYELGTSTAKMTLSTVTRYRQLVGMGAYIIVFPDGAYYNTMKPSDQGYIYKSKSYTSASVSYTLCNSQGDGITATTVKPQNPQDGDYWIDTSEVPHVLKRWSEIYQDWTTIPSTFTKIAASDIDDNFSEMDAVKISNSTVIENGTYTIYHKGSGYIVVPFLLEQVATATENLKVERTFPDMDFVVESGNRLWGCRYSKAGESAINEIYACALGDFKNWNRFLGISTDSYVASRGSDGPWTGAVSYLGTPIFFKENCIETVYPSNTGAHEIQSLNINGTGVAPGAWKTVSVVDGAVYYQGVSGFYTYTGGLPKKISYALGDNYFTSGCAGDLAGFYYVSAADSKTNHILVFDTNLGTWYREDDTKANCFCRVGSELYFATDDKLYTVRGTVGSTERVHWIVVTHDFASNPRKTRTGRSEDYNDKQLEKISIRANLAAGSEMKIYISYDSSYAYDLVGTLTGDGTSRYYNYPIVPARCDHYRLKFDCEGDGCLWSVNARYDHES